MWGSTYLGIRIAVETIPPFLMAGTRFLAAGVILYGWSAWRSGRAGQPQRPSLREWRDSIIVSAGLLLGGMGFVALGEQTIPSGIAAVMIALMPAWLAIFSRAFFGDRLPRVVLFGIVIGLVGIVALAWPTETGALEPFGLLALILSPVFWSLGSLYSARKATLPSRPLLATAMQMLAGGTLLTIAGLATGEAPRFHVDAISPASASAFAYLVLVGSLVGYSSYVWLLRVAPLPRISTYAYVNPVVAVFLGALVVGEPITLRTLVASAVIVIGVALIVTARGRAPEPGVAEPEVVAPAADLPVPVATEPEPDQPGPTIRPRLRAK